MASGDLVLLPNNAEDRYKQTEIQIPKRYGSCLAANHPCPKCIFFLLLGQIMLIHEDEYGYDEESWEQPGDAEQRERWGSAGLQVDSHTAIFETFAGEPRKIGS